MKSKQLLINVLFILITLISFSAGAEAFTVTNTSDSGEGSFRRALIDSNSTGGSDTIEFSRGSATEATLIRSILPTITEGVTIGGPLGTRVIINANRSGRGFIIAFKFIFS